MDTRSDLCIDKIAMFRSQNRKPEKRLIMPFNGSGNFGRSFNYRSYPFIMEKYTIQVQLGEGTDALWEPVLELPIIDAHHFSFKPFKWLRYVTAVIFGAEGHLHGEGGDVVNYDDPAPLLRVLRYHPSAVFKVIDPQGLDHLSSSQWSTAAERVSDRH